MLHYEFMRNAFAAAGLVAVLAGCTGWFLLLRNEAFAGHALGHIGFTGATGAGLIGLPPLAGLVGMTLAAGIGMGLLGRRLLDRDVAIGLILTLALGLGLLFLHYYTAYASQAVALLFGDVLAVDRATVAGLAAIAALTLAALCLLARPLLFASLHPELAAAAGLSPRRLGVAFLAIVALATAGCAQIVGVLLVFTLMVGPAAAAQRLTRRVLPGVLLAPALALVEAWSGLALAYTTGLPTSFWIAILSFSVFAVALAISALRARFSAA